MNTEELLLLVENVQQSYSFSNSPVNYIADLLKPLASDDALSEQLQQCLNEYLQK